MQRRLSLIFLLFATFSAGCVQSPEHSSQNKPGPFTLVQAGQARATIVIGKNAEYSERHSADELVAFVEKMSGARLPIREVANHGDLEDVDGPIVAVGLADHNPVISALIEKGLLTDPGTLEGHDGYTLSSLKSGGRAVLALAGSNRSSAPYPVYHLLEHEFGCGFFQDGDFIPTKDTLTVRALRVEESSRFMERYGVSPLTTGGWYTPGQLYSYEDWKQTIDWMVKHRLNFITHISTQGATELVRQRALQRFHGEEPTYQASDTKPPYHARQVKLEKRVLAYVRSLGVVAPIWVKHAPHLKFEVRMNRPQTGEGDYVTNFSLSHPGYSRWIQLFIEEHIKEFGTDHYYGGVGEPYSEQRFPEGAVFDDFLAASARYPLEAVKRADPEGISTITGWPFLYWGNNVARMKGYMDNVGGDDFRVLDCGSAGTEAGNFYWGRPWVAGGVLFFGGDFTYFGDYANHQKGVQKLLANPKADKCVGIAYNSELIDYNSLTFEFVSRASWNLDVDIDAYHKHYARIRYGEALAPVMETVVDTIYKSCYQSPDSLMRWPIYSLYQRLDPRDRRADMPREALEQIAGVEKCLDSMLGVADREEARNNPLFGRDVVDTLRQEIVLLTNQAGVQQMRAYDRKDAEAVRQIGAEVASLLREQAFLCSSRPQYRVEWLAAHFARSPEEKAPIAKAIRGHCYNHSQLNCLDYPRKDIFELIKFYYLPRWEWYTNELVACLEEGREYPKVNEQPNDPPAADAPRTPNVVFHEFDKKWKEHGYLPSEATPTSLSMVEASSQVYRNVVRSDAYKNIMARLVEDARVAEKKEGGDRQDFYTGHLSSR